MRLRERDEHPRTSVVRLVPRPESSTVARLVVREMCAVLGIDRLVDDASLVVAELVTNAAVHARTPIELTLQARGDALRIEVTDESSDRPSVGNPDGARVRGRGLAVVDRVARAWGVEPRGDGKVVWAVVDGEA